MFKNANIRSKKEAVQRLIDGEVFYHNNLPVHFSEMDGKPSPFRCNKSPMPGGIWDTYKEWQIKIEWYENIGDGVLCWVSNESNPPKNRPIELITGHNSDEGFRGVIDFWRYATPLTEREIRKYSFDRKPACVWSTGAAAGFEEKPGARRPDGTSVP